MTQSILESINDLDTKRESLYCMQILPPKERCCFLLWICDQVNLNRATGPFVTVSNPSGEAMESWLDMWMLVSNWQADPSVILAELERRTRQFTSRRGIETVG